MSRREVKASIRSQVLLVFFLPLAVAGAHTAAALPMVMRMLALLNLTNQRLYVACSAVCFLVFGCLLYTSTDLAHDVIAASFQREFGLLDHLKKEI